MKTARLTAMAMLALASRIAILIIVAGSVCCVTAKRSEAVSFAFITSRGALGANDSVDWGQLGADDTFAPNPSNVTSALGVTFSVNKTQANSFLRADEGGLIYHGDFTPGDHLITTNDQNSNPNVIVLGQGSFLAAGAQIEADAQGDFTARVTGFDSLGGVLATYIASGSANPTGAGTGLAPFMGIESLDGTTFASIRFDVISAAGDSAFFTINSISIRQVPEPSTLAMSLPGLCGFIALAIGCGWRRQKRCIV